MDQESENITEDENQAIQDDGSTAPHVQHTRDWYEQKPNGKTKAPEESNGSILARKDRSERDISKDGNQSNKHRHHQKKMGISRPYPETKCIKRRIRRTIRRRGGRLRETMRESS